MKKARPERPGALANYNPGETPPRGYNYIAVYFLSSELLLLGSLLLLSLLSELLSLLDPLLDLPELLPLLLPVLPWSIVLLPLPVPPTPLADTPKCEYTRWLQLALISGQRLRSKDGPACSLDLSTFRVNVGCIPLADAEA
jgi:hypothetical protein